METPEASRYAGMLRSPARVQNQPPTSNIASTPMRPNTTLTHLRELSQRADDLLVVHWQRLHDMGLAMQFDNATLATKYWTPSRQHGGVPAIEFLHTLSNCKDDDLDLLDMSLQHGHGCLDSLVESVTVAEPNIKR